MPGSVSISLEANGEPENFYADGGVYYVINNNCGYDGDLELALIPESFRTDILKETLDSKGVQTEKLSLKAVPLANGMVKAKTGNTTNATTYADWYKAVYVPAAESNDEYKGYAQIATQMDFDAFYQNLCVLYNDSVLTLDAHLSILYLNGGVLHGNN